MGLEIERKFLVDTTKLPPGLKGLRYRQGLLSDDPEEDLRVRVCEETQEALLVVKGPRRGVTRREYDYEICIEDGRALLGLCKLPPVEKIRYRIEHEGHRWVVDEFLGENKGLWLAEIELDSEDEAFARPPWLREEVSYDERYYNNNLVKYPYARWGGKPAGPAFTPG